MYLSKIMVQTIFKNLEDIMIDNGVINTKVSYSKLIYNEK